MKKSLKIVFISLMMLSMILVTTSVFADDTFNYKPGDVTMNAEGTNNVKEIGSNVLGIVRVVGTIIAVAMLIILGIKYMMGSAEERAEYKKTLFPYFIGAVLIFAASSLADMIYTWAQKL